MPNSWQPVPTNQIFSLSMILYRCTYNYSASIFSASSWQGHGGCSRARLFGSSRGRRKKICQCLGGPLNEVGNKGVFSIFSTFRNRWTCQTFCKSQKKKERVKTGVHIRSHICSFGHVQTTHFERSIVVTCCDPCPTLQRWSRNWDGHDAHTIWTCDDDGVWRLKWRCRGIFVGTKHMEVSRNRGTPTSSILVGCSMINQPFNQPFWGYPKIMETPIDPGWTRSTLG